MKKSISDMLSRKGIQPISMLTAYDYHTACTIDEAGVDMILVGDSLGNVMLLPRREERSRGYRYAFHVVSGLCV